MWYHLRKIVRAGCYPPNKVETKDYDAMIDGSNIRTCGNITKTIIGHIEEYKTGYLCYFYFKSNCNLIAIDLTKQQGLDADLKAIQQIIYIGDLDWTVNTKKKNYYSGIARNYTGVFTKIYRSKIIFEIIIKYEW